MWYNMQRRRASLGRMPNWKIVIAENVTLMSITRTVFTEGACCRVRGVYEVK